MSKPASTFSLESAVTGIFEHWQSLVVAALFFAGGIGLSQLTTFSTSSLASYITIGTLIQQFIAGLMVAIAFIIAFAKTILNTPIGTMVTEAKTVAVSGVIWTIGMLLVGIGNSNGFTPVGIIASLAGYALLLVSIILSGTLGASIAVAKAAPKPA